MEPRGNVAAVWGQYSLCVGAGGGALLLCVVGGKMSEGINFSDALGAVMLGINNFINQPIIFFKFTGINFRD